VIDMPAMLRLKVALVVVALMGVGGVTAAVASGGDDRSRFETDLTGYEEAPVTFSTTGNGTFRAAISRSADEIRYQLTYSGLEGAVQQAHIHLGGKALANGISVFLCTNLGNGPVGTQSCPPSGTVTGTIRPVDVIGPAAQGIAAGEFDELVRAIRAGATYVNVHSDLRPGGEIRGQLGDEGHDEDDD
jgi:hypothetical protein